MSREFEFPDANSFREALCIFSTQLVWVFGLAVLLLLVSLVSLAVVEPGTGTYVVTVMNLVALTIFAVLSGAVLLLCRDEA